MPSGSLLLTSAPLEPAAPVPAGSQVEIAASDQQAAGSDDAAPGAEQEAAGPGRAVPKARRARRGTSGKAIALAGADASSAGRSEEEARQAEAELLRELAEEEATEAKKANPDC